MTRAEAKLRIIETLKAGPGVVKETIADDILFALDGAVVLDQEIGEMKAHVTAAAGLFPKG